MRQHIVDAIYRTCWKSQSDEKWSMAALRTQRAGIVESDSLTSPRECSPKATEHCAMYASDFETSYWHRPSGFGEVQGEPVPVGKRDGVAVALLEGGFNPDVST